MKFTVNKQHVFWGLEIRIQDTETDPQLHHPILNFLTYLSYSSFIYIKTPTICTGAYIEVRPPRKKKEEPINWRAQRKPRQEKSQTLTSLSLFPGIIQSCSGSYRHVKGLYRRAQEIKLGYIPQQQCQNSRATDSPSMRNASGEFTCLLPSDTVN